MANSSSDLKELDALNAKYFSSISELSAIGLGQSSDSSLSSPQPTHKSSLKKLSPKIAAVKNSSPASVQPSAPPLSEPQALAPAKSLDNPGAYHAPTPPSHPSPSPQSASSLNSLKRLIATDPGGQTASAPNALPVSAPHPSPPQPPCSPSQQSLTAPITTEATTPLVTALSAPPENSFTNLIATEANPLPAAAPHEPPQNSIAELIATEPSAPPAPRPTAPGADTCTGPYGTQWSAPPVSMPSVPQQNSITGLISTMPSAPPVPSPNATAPPAPSQHTFTGLIETEPSAPPLSVSFPPPPPPSAPPATMQYGQPSASENTQSYALSSDSQSSVGTPFSNVISSHYYPPSYATVPAYHPATSQSGYYPTLQYSTSYPTAPAIPSQSFATLGAYPQPPPTGYPVISAVYPPQYSGAQTPAQSHPVLPTQAPASGYATSPSVSAPTLPVSSKALQLSAVGSFKDMLGRIEAVPATQVVGAHAAAMRVLALKQKLNELQKKRASYHARQAGNVGAAAATAILTSGASLLVQGPAAWHQRNRLQQILQAMREVINQINYIRVNFGSEPGWDAKEASVTINKKVFTKGLQRSELHGVL